MFSVISWSPPLIHILVPDSRYEPSGCGSARVVRSASDEPACGSDRHMVPVNRPWTIGRTQVSICSGVPYRSSRLALPTVSMAYALVATLAAANQPKPAAATVAGSCRPPTAASMLAPITPAAPRASSACLTAGRTVTRSPSSSGSCRSPSFRCGANRSSATSAHRSRTASKVSRECSANRARPVSSSTRSHSYSRKSRSRRDSRSDVVMQA
jgi:hypothetical protein